MESSTKFNNVESIFKISKIVAWVCLTGYCLKKVYDTKATYDLKRITTSQYSEIKNPFQYPAITACVNMDREITGPSGNMTWWSNDKYRNYTQLPFELIPTLDEGFCRYSNKCEASGRNSSLKGRIVFALVR